MAQAGAEFVRENKLKEVEKAFIYGIVKCREIGIENEEIKKIFMDYLDLDI